MSLKNIVKVANYYNVKYGFEKVADETSQLGDLQKAILNTGLFPVKYGNETYHQSHPMHNKMVQVLDNNEYPSTKKVITNIIVTPERDAIFDMRFENPDDSKSYPNLKKQFEDLLKKETLSKVLEALKKVSPPANNMSIYLFTI